ncbi:MAG: tetratricopeptide repeat protein [Luteolibacter sp.]
MKTKQLLMIAATGLVLAAYDGASAAETSAEKLERGVNLQQTDGDLDAAIREYKAVLRDDANSEKLASEARFRLAECYHLQGDDVRMREHIDALRSSLPAENKWVQRAAVLVPVKTEFSGVPWNAEGRLYRYATTMKNGKNLGTIAFAIRKTPNENKPIWEVFNVRTAGVLSLSSSRFMEEDYRTLEGRWYMCSIGGDMSCEFGNDGLVRTFDKETEEEKGIYDPSTSNDSIPLFENEQMIQLMRTLNQKIGTKQKTRLIVAFNGATPIDFDMEVTEHVDIEVPAGKFSCAKIETNLNQTFYISRDEQRIMVRFDLGVAKVSLEAEEFWDGVSPQTLKSENFPFTCEIPGQMIAMEPTDNDKVYRIQLWSSDFAGRDSMLIVKPIEKESKSPREMMEARLEKAEESYDSLEIDESSWESLEFAGMEGVACHLTVKTGELTDHEYSVRVQDEKRSLEFRINYAEPDKQAARNRAHEILNAFQWID